MATKCQADVSIIILTKNAGDTFYSTLSEVYAQEYAGEFEVVIVDSGSTDKTVNIAQNYPAKIISIEPGDFGHGKTRNLGADSSKGKYLVFLTQDAVPATKNWLTMLVRNFEDQDVAGIYGRQIPKENTNPMEYFFLNSKYPSYKIVKQVKENQTDINTIFFSNVNSAISRRVWEKYPFDENNFLGSEDQRWAKTVLLSGYKVIYEPEAAVYHSHNLSLKAAFQKYFDFGVSFNQFASSEYATNKFAAEGIAYVMKETKFLIGNGYIKWLPYGVFYNMSKFLGFYLGKQQKYLPLAVKRRLSMSSHLWSGRKAGDINRQDAGAYRQEIDPIRN